VLVVVVSVVVAPQESKESRRLARIHENPAGESTRIQRENPAVRFAAERNLRNLTEKSTSKNLASFTAGARLKCLWMSRPGAWRVCCIAILLNMACFLFSVCLEPFDYT
jgi:hypothetical protein